MCARFCLSKIEFRNKNLNTGDVLVDCTILIPIFFRIVAQKFTKKTKRKQFHEGHSQKYDRGYEFDFSYLLLKLNNS